MIRYKSLTICLILSLIGIANALGQESEIYTDNGIAIRGYDPVAFFTKNDALEGKSEFSFKWKDATWYFVSKEHQELFMAKPEAYAPQFGGYCAWGMREGYKAETKPKNAWTVYNNKLYLNYNKDTTKGWKEAKDQNIEMAESNWSKMTHQ